MPIELSNVRKMAAIIARLSIARKLRGKLLDAATLIEDIKGEDSLGKILSIAENAVLDNDYSVNDNSSSEKLSKIGEGLEEYINNLIDNPVDQIGYPIGLPEYEKAIGGGLRPGGVNVIAARMKSGKTFIVDHACINAARKGIKVLNLDTEMQKSDHWIRLCGKISGKKLDDIETGKVRKEDMKPAIEELKKLEYSYRNIGGMDTEEIFSLMRRWLIREVGLDSKGQAKSPCLIVYDYLKLMDSSAITHNIAEYQAIGFLVTNLHNFMKKYNVACLALVQLNRKGADEESSTTVSQSDRILWLCTSMSIFKWKEREDLISEMNKPEESRYTHKIIVTDCRFGKGTSPGDFIHIKTDYSIGKIEEGPLDSNLAPGSREEKERPQNGEDVQF
jgi:replicative DNA helicase